MNGPVTDEIWAAVNAYLDAHNRRPPQYIALPPEKSQALKEQVNATLPREMAYVPSHFYGIPIVNSTTERDIKCLP